MSIRTVSGRALLGAALLGGLLASPVRAASEDPLYDHLWGLEQIAAPEAWGATRGRGIQVAVVDTGTDLDHPDLAANMLPGATFLGCGTESCGNGDWQSHDPSGHSHGTHVAGTIAAVANNGTGVVGVAPEAQIIPVRVLDGRGRGSVVDVALGMRWAVDHGADVISLSLGTNVAGVVLSETLGTPLNAAVQYASAHDVVVVAAAGNDSLPHCSTPAWESSALCVTATDKRELPTFYTNHGVKPELDSVAAPGGSVLEVGSIFVKQACAEGVLSTVPPGSALEGFTEACDYPSDLAYEENSGTSMATPHVSGTAALVMSLGCTAPQTVDIIEETARPPVDAGADWYYAYGHGIVDAASAVQRALTTCDGDRERPEPTQDDCLFDASEDFEFDGRVNGPPVPPGWERQSSGNDVGLLFPLGDGRWRWSSGPPLMFAGMSYPSLFTEATGLTAKEDSVISPPMRASDSTEIEFLTSYSLEEGKDGGVVEVSTDGGASWQDVGATSFIYNGYNGRIQGASSSPIEGRQAFTGVSSRAEPFRRFEHVGHARVVRILLDDFEEKVIRIRWRLVQDGQRTDSTPGMYWGIDEVRVKNLLREECVEAS